MKKTKKNVFTYLSEWGKQAFSLAEVLITLGIIGVVAAMTLPTLIAKHQKEVTVVQLKKTYDTLCQAYIMSESENGFSDEWVDTSVDVSADVVKQYVQKYWQPYLKVYKECNTTSDCSYVQGSDSMTMIGNSRYTLILSDGTMIAFVPFSWSEEKGKFFSNSQRFYIDVNGTTKPNLTGKDIFIFEVDLTKHIMRGYGQNLDISKINSSCSTTGNKQYCAAKIILDGWQIKDDYPFKF